MSSKHSTPKTERTDFVTNPSRRAYMAAYMAAYRKSNKAFKERQQSYYAARRATPEHKAYMAAYYSDYIRSQAGRSNKRATQANRRARKQQAIPPWYGELDDLVWQEAARLTVLREASTGFSWHADHLIPICCTKASGLHVASNCQVIPARLNVAKGNRLIFTAPGEWITAL